MLREHDARQLVSAVVTELHLLGVSVQQMAVHDDGDGLRLDAEIHGRVVSSHLPAIVGAIPYRAMALDLMRASQDAARQWH